MTCPFVIILLLVSLCLTLVMLHSFIIISNLWDRTSDFMLRGMVWRPKNNYFRNFFKKMLNFWFVPNGSWNSRLEYNADVFNSRNKILKWNICSSSLILVNSNYLHGNASFGTIGSWLFEIKFIVTTCIIKTS